MPTGKDLLADIGIAKQGGLFILHEDQIFGRGLGFREFGLYRDDGK